MKLRISLVFLLALVPSLAFARPRGVTTHMRPQLFRDRAPKARLHDVRLHEGRVRAPKSPPPPAVKEEF